MVLEDQPLPFLTWLLGLPWTEAEAFLKSALFQFVLTVAAGAVVALVGGYLLALLRNGPIKAGDITYRVVTNGLAELLRTSPRRVWAIARLVIKESVRRRVIVAFAIYLIILLFAGWFLQTGYREPAKLYFSFVLTATTYLVLAVGLLLSAFSLPNDFKTKTIFTVVTKPVRAGDIVLGRILGFTVVGTVLLAIMAFCGSAFVWRMLDHTHTVKIESLEDKFDSTGKVVGKKGRTSTNIQHSHEVEVYTDGSGLALSANEHEHKITGGPGGEYVVSGAEGLFRARVPYYGKLGFLDRNGVPVAKGVSVGNEWTYRSFIEGGTPMAAIWTFEHISSKSFRRDETGAETLPIELIVRVFRTYKGDIEKGIQGVLQLRNPDKNKILSEPWTFTAKDNSINTFGWSRKLNNSEQQPIDLLENLVSKDGRLEVVVQCLDRAQYYGFAQPDCYVRLPDGSPLFNYIKAQASIWIQMVLVIAIGVTCSTLVNTPVAILFTISFITLGFFRDFFLKVAIGEQVGGGPLESLYRIVTQMNQISPLPEGFASQLIQFIDYVLKTGMLSLTYLLPNFRSLSTVGYVAYGYDIPLNRLAQDLLVCLVYVIGSFIVGYFFLRTREVAK